MVFAIFSQSRLRQIIDLVPHMIFAVPTSWRRAHSFGGRKLAPMWHWRSKYSVGVSDIFSTVGPPKMCSEDGSSRFIRS